MFKRALDIRRAVLGAGAPEVAVVLNNLAQVYELPMVLYIAWAGYKGRDVPHHNVIGRPLEQLLQALSIPIVHCVLDQRIRKLEKAIMAARQLALASSQPVALLAAPEES